jgi:arylsulfatase A-like enzyme
LFSLLRAENALAWRGACRMLRCMITRLLALVVALPGLLLGADAKPRPNILWITSEDNGPQLGCYGDAYATTPHLDKLASEGMLFLNAWSTAPVCAPARTAIISGLFPSSTGSEHMRSMAPIPSWMKLYPQFLREAGYYCSNNSKTDYNLQEPARLWNDSSNKAHWKNRPAGQPFFAIFNHTISHESQTRRHDKPLKHDPARVPLPAYHPDTPEVRRDWARYYDRISEMDELAGNNLRELAQAGLADDTIVFYYGDHGAGMPRSKRWPYNSGLRVPLIVYVPEKFRHLAPEGYAPGARSEQLVDFVDLAPTLLSLVGIQPPDWMEGRAFMGEFAGLAPEFLHGLRGRMDERYDLVRTVRDQRYIYIRNYMPHKIYGQHIDYMFQTPTTRVWKQLYDEGKLRPPQTFFWEPKPPEELYDLQHDPDEVRNLAGSPEHQHLLERFRAAHLRHVLKTRDTGFLPEGELHSRSKGSTPYEMSRDPSKYPLEKILAAADLASSLKPEALPALKQMLKDEDSAVRYWATLGILMRGRSAVNESRRELESALADSSPYVRINAAEALGTHGTAEDAARVLPMLVELSSLQSNPLFVALWSLNAIDALGMKAAGAADAIKALPRSAPGEKPRTSSYAPRLIEDITARLDAALRP